METGSGVFYTKIKVIRIDLNNILLVIHPEFAADSDYQHISHNDNTEDTYLSSTYNEILLVFFSVVKPHLRRIPAGIRISFIRLPVKATPTHRTVGKDRVKA